MKKIKALALTGLISSALTGCGNTLGQQAPYIPVIQPPQATITNSSTLPQLVVGQNRPSLPDGKAAKSMRFDMEIEQVETELENGSTVSTEGEKIEETLQVKADEMTAPIGRTKQFSVEITLEDDQVLNKYTRINWESTNKQIGSINSSGVFTPIREGTTKIIASLGGVATTLIVHVTPGQFQWKQIQAPTQANLYGIKLVSDTEAWAVGAGGTMLHYLRGTWYNLTPQLHAITNGANLYSIDMISPQEGWAVGDNTILHFYNGRWNRVRIPVAGTFKSVDMINPQIGWIVGDSGGEAITMRFNGPMGWQPMMSGIEKPLNSVSVIGPRHAWAVGESSNLQRPGIYQYTGDTWEKVRFTNALIDWKRPTGRYNIKAIKMVNSSQGWAVGEYDPLLSSVTGKRGAMFKYDAINDIWTEVELGVDQDKRFQQVTYNAIGMLNPNEGWILGNTTEAALDLSVNNEINGNLMKTDGQNISVASDFQVRALPDAFNGIDVVEHGHGIIVGDKGLIMHREYDLNYRYKRSNFSNFNGQAGLGYNNVPTVGQPQVGY